MGEGVPVGHRANRPLRSFVRSFGSTRTFDVRQLRLGVRSFARLDHDDDSAATCRRRTPATFAEPTRHARITAELNGYRTVSCHINLCDPRTFYTLERAHAISTSMSTSLHIILSLTKPSQTPPVSRSRRKRLLSLNEYRRKVLNKFNKI